MITTETIHRKYSIESSRKRVSEIAGEIVRYLQEETPVSGCECVFDIKVVLNELIANAVIHGNEEDRTKPVDITVSYNEKMLEFTVADRGKKFIPSDTVEEKLLCESNRGISMCHILCKKIKYSYTEGVGNSVKAVFILKEIIGGN